MILKVMGMKVVDTKINDVKIISPKVFGDSRGFFLETFERKRYQEALNIDYDFVQDNYSRSSKGVLRAGKDHVTTVF